MLEWVEYPGDLPGPEGTARRQTLLSMLLLQLRSRTFCFPRPIHLQYHQQVGLDPGVHQGWSQEYSINQITITERDNFVNFALTRENYVTFQVEIIGYFCIVKPKCGPLLFT